MANLTLYGGPAAWNTYSGFVAQQGYLQSGPIQYNAPVATLAGNAFPVDLLGYGAAPRTNNDWVWCYLFLAPDNFSPYASPALWVEHEVNSFYAACTGTNSDGTSAQTGTLTVYLADLATTVSAHARLIDASITSDRRTFGSLEMLITWRLFEDLH